MLKKSVIGLLVQPLTLDLFPAKPVNQINRAHLLAPKLIKFVLKILIGVSMSMQKGLKQFLQILQILALFIKNLVVKRSDFMKTVLNTLKTQY